MVYGHELSREKPPLKRRQTDKLARPPPQCPGCEKVLAAAVEPNGAGWPHEWFWDGHEHVDPVKEARAQATRLANQTATLATEYARVGLDWETELRQRAKEASLMEELGLARLSFRE